MEVRALTVVLLCGVGAARAQQAIVSMPSADQTPAGHAFVMHETQLRAWEPKPWWNTTHFLTWGLTDEVELAATLFNVGVPQPGLSTLALGYKAAHRLAPDRLPTWLELTATHGAMALVDLQSPSLGAWLYGHLSGRLPVLGTRLAVGASWGGRQLFGNETVCVIASAEQPLDVDRRWNLVAEWFSGNHELANFIGGVSFHPDHTWLFVAGFKVPTATRPEWRDFKHALVLEVGAFFE